MTWLVRKDFESPQDFHTVWQAMRDHVDLPQTVREKDEVWLLEHSPVYTLGQAGKTEHVLNPGKIPLVKTDRGGQVTYHGPGQLVAYCLFDIKRQGIGVKTLVCKLETALMDALSDYGISSHLKDGAPGVYVNDKKIASLGLRLRRGVSYHGLSLNVDMDLSPFQGINPCGFAGMQMTQLKDFVPTITLETVKNDFMRHLVRVFDYEGVQ